MATNTPLPAHALAAVMAIRAFNSERKHFVANNMPERNWPYSATSWDLLQSKERNTMTSIMFDVVTDENIKLRSDLNAESDDKYTIVPPMGMSARDDLAKSICAENVGIKAWSVLSNQQRNEQAGKIVKVLAAFEQAYGGKLAILLDGVKHPITDPAKLPPVEATPTGLSHDMARYYQNAIASAAYNTLGQRLPTWHGLTYSQQTIAAQAIQATINTYKLQVEKEAAAPTASASELAGELAKQYQMALCDEMRSMNLLGTAWEDYTYAARGAFIRAMQKLIDTNAFNLTQFVDTTDLAKKLAPLLYVAAKLTPTWDRLHPETQKGRIAKTEACLNTALEATPRVDKPAEPALTRALTDRLTQVFYEQQPTPMSRTGNLWDGMWITAKKNKQDMMWKALNRIRDTSPEIFTMPSDPAKIEAMVKETLAKKATVANGDGLDVSNGSKVVVKQHLTQQEAQMIEAVRKTGLYGSTAHGVIRSFMLAGVREAIDSDYIFSQSEEVADQDDVDGDED